MLDAARSESHSSLERPPGALKGATPKALEARSVTMSACDDSQEGRPRNGGGHNVVIKNGETGIRMDAAMKRKCLGIAAILVLLVVSAVARAATVPSGLVDAPFVNIPGDVTAMAFAPDGRLFVCQQSGKLRIVQNANLLATPFLTLNVDDAGERGLLGVAFDPNFATNDFVYAYYTATSPTIHNRVSRFTANGNVAVPGSEVVLLELNTLSGATNHNGGVIHFGNDAKLYCRKRPRKPRSYASAGARLIDTLNSSRRFARRLPGARPPR